MVTSTVRWLLALGLALYAPIPSAFAQGTVVGPGNLILCVAGAQATIATATTTSLINGVAGKVITICGWHVTSSQSASSTFQFIYGTQGGPCGGSPVNLTPAFSVTSTAPSADHIDYATLQVPAGQQLCVVTVGSTIAQGVLVYYSQF